MSEQVKLILGSSLRAGDVIDVWWTPRRDTITKLVPYTGPLKCFEPEGAQLADFAINKSGMTIENRQLYKVLARMGGSL
jgi:hypothetical protein